jgi:hypothetical protein
MVDGMLVALYPPAALKEQSVPGRVFVVRGSELDRAREAFRQDTGELALAPFGAGLHLRVERDGWDEARLHERLRALGAKNVEIEATESTLEDVFLEV